MKTNLNAKTTKCMFISRHCNLEQNHGKERLVNKPFENVRESKHSENIVTN
jgi:hypothetical protein